MKRNRGPYLRPSPAPTAPPRQDDPPAFTARTERAQLEQEITEARERGDRARLGHLLGLLAWTPRGTPPGSSG